MSDTCIVCLGLLDSSVAEHSDILKREPTADVPSAVLLPAEAPTLPNGHTNHNPSNASSPELIAHLRPCGHDLHNECLKPWVERANSCPICRANFHLVELMLSVGGTVLSSYAVQDKTQVADIDASLYLDIPDEDDEGGACQRCGHSDNEDILMYCDGCAKLWHTYCVGLDDVPYASWFCESCAAERAIDPQQRSTRRTRGTVSRRRTRGMERLRRNHNATHDDGWNQVWQSVYSNLNLDLDFPFDDDESPAALLRRHRQAVETDRREHEAWERRMRVAELAGAGNRFRQNVSTLLDDSGSSTTHPRVTRPRESAEEMAAWDAFNQAREEPFEPETSSSRRPKRKSRSPSPALRQSSASPAREVKRRRTSTPAVPPQPRIEPVRAPSSPSRRMPTPQPRPRTVLDSATPSFLQSLLQEVEESAGPSHLHMYRPTPRNPGSPPTEQQSPRPSSPATSNPSSPRAMSATPPPFPNGFRPSSPPGLSSSIVPVFPPAGFSPRSPVEEKEKVQESPPIRQSAARIPPAPSIPRPKPRRPRIPDAALTARPRSNDTSPTRITLSVDKKADVQKLVSAALKPHYHEQKISKDEYTVINRDVSRMLYDKIGDFEALDLEGKAKWERVAGEEVNKAVTALRV